MQDITVDIQARPSISEMVVANNDTRDRLIDFCRKIAEHLCRNQSPDDITNPVAGSFPWLVSPDGKTEIGNNWNHAFAIIGLLRAAVFYDNPKYENAALLMARWIKSLQILDKFHPVHYGAIREVSPITNWSYPRDAASTAWGFLRLYEYTGEDEYLKRAGLFAKWFIQNALDDEGWPLWGILFDPKQKGIEPQIRNDLHGSFHGGSLHFFYLLAKLTGDAQWTGPAFLRMADILLHNIQQSSGYFKSIDKQSKRIPPIDPQNGLHHANDDFCSLGLLDAYKITGNEKYLKGTKKFISAILGAQDGQGYFDETIASIPVTLNILWACEDYLENDTVNESQISKAINCLLNSQCIEKNNPQRYGGLYISKNDKTVCARGTCYALIVILKILSSLNS